MKYTAAELKLAQIILAAFPPGQSSSPPAVSVEEWPDMTLLAEQHGLLPLLRFCVTAAAARERPRRCSYSIRRTIQ